MSAAAMPYDHWSLSDIAWDRLTPTRVSSELLETVKTAALVEANSADYVTYLRNVFGNDHVFCAAVDRWGHEERQHGDALGRWAELVDPEFSFEHALANFRAGYRLPLEATESVRGSRAGELVARCVVESGTCSFYAAIRDATDDPVLKQICVFIAQDEAQHYRLFHAHLQRYLDGQPLRGWRRVQIALGRVKETDDDELSYAFYSANFAATSAPPSYDRRLCSRAYWRRALGLYQPRHIKSAGFMIARAAGIDPGKLWFRHSMGLLWRLIRWRRRRLANDPVVP